MCVLHFQERAQFNSGGSRPAFGFGVEDELDVSLVKSVIKQQHIDINNVHS